MLDEINFLKKIEVVCSHPRIYTSKGTFDDAAIFLESYGKSVIVGEFYYHSVFTPFLKWFVEKNNIQEKTVSLKRFRESFSSDNEALKNLPILYREYLESI